MTFEVELGGRHCAVAIEPADRPGRFRVTVDGQRHVVDVCRTGEFGLSLLLGAGTSPGESAAGTNPSGAGAPFSSRDSHQEGTARWPELVPAPLSVDLHVTPDGASGQLLVTLGGRTATAIVNGRRTGHAADAGAHGHGDISITAPMPGRVVRVLVAPGEEISARQGVVVVEAMKMENELRAPRAGRVKEVAVAPGTSVEAGRVLAVIE